MKSGIEKDICRTALAELFSFAGSQRRPLTLLRGRVELELVEEGGGAGGVARLQGTCSEEQARLGRDGGLEVFGAKDLRRRLGSVWRSGGGLGWRGVDGWERSGGW